MQEGIKIVKHKRNEHLGRTGESTSITIAVSETHEESEENDAIADVQLSRFKETIYIYTYLYALCLRRTQKYEEASTAYRKVRKHYSYQD